jgi:tetratricopeptide (TPR) repeat protein
MLVPLAVTYAGVVDFGNEPLPENAIPAQIMIAAGTADSLNRKGLSALEHNDFETALTCFEKALDILPEYSDARNNCGVVKFRQGDIAGAKEIWARLVARDPAYPIGLFNLSLVQAHAYSFDSIITLLEGALRIDEHFTEARVRLGWAYLQKGEKEKAIEVLKPAYLMSPKSPDVESYYAFALMATGDTAGAIAVCRKHPDNGETLKLLGRIERSRRNYPAAAAAFSQAGKRGDDPWLLPELADMQIEARQYGEALSTLRKYFGSAIAHSADAYLLAGIAAKETGDLPASESYFEQGSVAFPDDYLLRYNLGQVYFFENKYDRAESTWAGLADSLKDPSLLYLRAINADRRGDAAGAQSFIRRALAIDDRPDFHAFLGKLLYRHGDRKGAAVEFRTELGENPDLSDARLDLALCEKSGPELSAAAHNLEQRLSGCRGDSCGEIALELSAVYYSAGAIEKAVGVLDAVKDRDRTEEVCRMLSRCLRELHRWDEAVSVLEGAVGKYGMKPETGYELAETCLDAGFYMKAIDYYARLLEKWPENPWRLYYQLGYACLETNDLARAGECFEQSLKNRGDNVAARGLLAFVYNRQGKVREARELWQKTVADDPTNATLWINLGISYEKEGSYGDALADYKKAAELAKHDASLQIGIGNCYAALDSPFDALVWYKQALESPKRDIAAYDMFLIYSKKGQTEQAGEMLKILQGDFPTSSYTKRAAADVALRGGDTARTMDLLNGVPDKEPGDWLTLGRIYADRGEGEKAQECVARVPAGAPWERDIASIKMVLAFRRGDYSGVAQSVIASGDTGFPARYNLALSYYQLGRNLDALLLADTLARRTRGPDRVDLCRLAGNAAFRLKRWDDALAWYLQLSDMEASNPVVLYNCAVASYNKGKYDDAFSYYSLARQYDPHIHNADIERRHAAAHDTSSAPPRLRAADSLYNAALVLQTAGSDSAAEKLYDSVLAQDSLYSMAWNNLGTIYGKRGEIGKAETAYLKAVGQRHTIPETYVNLVNLYIELEKFATARQWLIRGEGYNPESGLFKDLKKKIVDAENRAGAGTGKVDSGQ